MSDHNDNPPKLGIIFLGRRRPGFDMDWGRRMEERVRGWLQQTGFPLFEAPEKAVDDASLRRVMAACDGQKVDALVLLQTTMGDARLAPTLAQLWPDPLILWATPEKPDGDMISSCSLVGAHCWASVLRQMGHGFELVYGDPDAAATQQRFREAARMAATIRGLRSARLGIIGGQAPGYFAMSGDPFAIHRGLGAQVQTFSLLEFATVVNELTPEAVAADVAKFKALGFPHKDTTDDDLPMSSRLYLAMRSFMENENLDALTIRCWPEMPNTFGQWPYLAVARLVDEGYAVAIEGDADGALSAWMVEKLGLGRCYLSDWLEHDKETITLWHGGAAPMSLCSPIGEPGGPRVARHFNIKKPAVIEANLRENMPITVFRLWRLEGKYHLTAREGETTKPKRHLMATNALARMHEDPGEWFEEICHQGMPHHVGVVEGHHAALLKRMARVMNIQYH
ncbi:MAG TPA: L-fucose/L-arabinose isomerase family protein [Candidatus Saccharimonadales bacterium]|nr:L-fucose/L-arabinose isomerase family protein [Candidatus Saccharimonadales bacterium]